MNRWKDIIRGNRNKTENYDNNTNDNNNNNSSPWQQQRLSLPFRPRSSGVTPEVSITADDGTTIQHPTASSSTHTTITEPSSHSDFHETRNSSPSIINSIDNQDSNGYGSVDNGDSDEEKRNSNNDNCCSRCSDQDGRNKSTDHTRVHFFPSAFDNREEIHQDDHQQEQLHPGQGAERRHSEETLVDEALGRQEARGRHIQFADHITESMSLIHGILNNRRRSSVWPQRDSIQMEEPGRRFSHHLDPHRRSSGELYTGGGSVLGSLLRLEAQLQSVQQTDTTEPRRPSARDNDQRRVTTYILDNFNNDDILKSPN